MFSRAMPTAAANLALSRLQSDSGLSRGYRYNIKLLEEDCSASKGLLTNQIARESTDTGTEQLYNDFNTTWCFKLNFMGIEAKYHTASFIQIR